ncbi:MAG: hypothetical protein Q4B60_04985 [Erysipelotrichaceae bacterium]|nr:hypothetical protein [Erysipelotrichaceae bacterium]
MNKLFNLAIVLLMTLTLSACGCSHKDVRIEGAYPADCYSDGFTGAKICNQCDKVLDEGTVIASTGHGETELVDVLASVPGQNGYTGDLMCKTCSEYLELGEVIDSYDISIAAQWLLNNHANFADASELSVSDIWNALQADLYVSNLIAWGEEGEASVSVAELQAKAKKVFGLDMNFAGYSNTYANNMSTTTISCDGNQITVNVVLKPGFSGGVGMGEDGNGANYSYTFNSFDEKNLASVYDYGIFNYSFEDGGYTGEVVSSAIILLKNVDGHYVIKGMQK